MKKKTDYIRKPRKYPKAKHQNKIPEPEVQSADDTPEIREVNKLKEQVQALCKKYGGSVIFVYNTLDCDSKTAIGNRVTLRGMTEELRDGLMKEVPDMREVL